VDHLVRIQCILQDVMSLVATPKGSSGEKHQHVHKILNVSVVEELETWIDEYSADLPPLKNFILPVSVYFFFSQINR
jgi:cob(I)alamin adenosyltransferase